MAKMQSQGTNDHTFQLLLWRTSYTYLLCCYNFVSLLQHLRLRFVFSQENTNKNRHIQLHYNKETNTRWVDSESIKNKDAQKYVQKPNVHWTNINGKYCRSVWWCWSWLMCWVNPVGWSKLGLQRHQQLTGRQRSSRIRWRPSRSTTGHPRLSGGTLIGWRGLRTFVLPLSRMFRANSTTGLEKVSNYLVWRADSPYFSSGASPSERRQKGR